MSSRGDLGVPVEEAQRFFEERWRDGDPWDVEQSELDQESHARQLALLEGRHYERVLELGCGAGIFTRRLAHVADWVVAIDISPSAIERARASRFPPAAVDFRVANIMDYEPCAEGPWDLVVISETIYYLGWLYPFFQIGWLASELFAATRAGGRLLMANTCGTERDHLLVGWLVRTYRDLFLNVGYGLEAEEIVRGVKHTVEYEILVDLFSKPVEATG